MKDRKSRIAYMCHKALLLFKPKLSITTKDE